MDNLRNVIPRFIVLLKKIETSLQQVLMAKKYCHAQGLLFVICRSVKYYIHMYICIYIMYLLMVNEQHQTLMV